jgi:hypothetical protein
MNLLGKPSVVLYQERHFNAEILTLWVRWSVTDKLSDRDLVAMMAGQCGRSAYDHPALGATLRPGIRKAVATLCPSSGNVVARR